MDTESPIPGCLVLGVDGLVDTVDIEQLKKRRPIYTTRHRINSYHQSKSLCREVASEVFVPCAAGHDENRPVACIWHAFRSELLLFVLHMSTLVFGVFKEAMDLRHTDEAEASHLAHTIIETIVTLFIVVLRMVNSRMSYVEVQVTVQRLQHFDPLHEPHLRAAWTWMWLLLASGAVNFIACIVCFVLFHQLSHLGWTVLSNQAIIIIMRLLDEFFVHRVQAAVKKIKEDQHKVVIHEALMLLRDTSAADGAESAETSTSPTTSTDVWRFIKAVVNTKSLAKPPYIAIGRGKQQL